MLNRLFTPSRESPLNPMQQETDADGDVAREAAHVCKIFGRPRDHIFPHHRALRSGFAPAAYLFGRFGGFFGWQSEADAERFYRKNK